MYNLVIVARSNVLTIAPKNGEETEVWSEVSNRVLNNVYSDGKVRIQQVDEHDMSEYYFEVDVKQGSTEYLTLLGNAIEDFNDFMHEYDFKMFIGSAVV